MGVYWIQNDLKTKLRNIEYRRQYQGVSDDEIQIDTSCEFYKANVEDSGGQLNKYD